MVACRAMQHRNVVLLCPTNGIKSLWERSPHIQTCCTYGIIIYIIQNWQAFGYANFRVLLRQLIF